MKAETMAKTLDLVAEELKQLATEVRTNGEGTILTWQERWSTYTLEAYAAVYERLLDDGVN